MRKRLTIESNRDAKGEANDGGHLPTRSGGGRRGWWWWVREASPAIGRWGWRRRPGLDRASSREIGRGYAERATWTGRMPWIPTVWPRKMISSTSARRRRRRPPARAPRAPEGGVASRSVGSCSGEPPGRRGRLPARAPGWPVLLAQSQRRPGPGGRFTASTADALCPASPQLHQPHRKTRQAVPSEDCLSRFLFSPGSPPETPGPRPCAPRARRSPAARGNRGGL